MNFWKRKYSVCDECHVHFEPATGYEARWGNFCPTHRKQVKERDEKKERVLSWASLNWERLERIMEDEIKQREDMYSQARYQQQMQPIPTPGAASLAAQYQNARGQQDAPFGFGLGGGV